MIKKLLALLLLLLIIFIVFEEYYQYEYVHAKGICRVVGNKESFYQKLDNAKTEHNVTLARILFIYYAHKCTDFTDEEKKNIKSIIIKIRKEEAMSN